MLWRISALLWAVFIFYLSTATFGEVTSQSFLARALAFFHLALSPAGFGTAHKVSRKLAHLTEYGIFALLLHRCFPIQGALRGERPRAFLSVLAAAAYSLTDEFHQVFVPGRHGCVTDCAIDSTGAALAMLLILGYRTFREEAAGVWSEKPSVHSSPFHGHLDAADES